MKTYEIVYIVDTSVAEEAREAVSAKLKDVITSNGGEVVSVDKWGVKKLAYPINDKADGDYFVMTFVAESSTIKELDRIVGLTSEVLRRMITVKA